MTNCHYINHQWRQGQGNAFSSIDPTTGGESWQGNAASVDEVDRAMQAARAAVEQWATQSLNDRINAIKPYADALKANQDKLVESICISTGKPIWEATQETGAMIGKVQLSIDAYLERKSDSQFDHGAANAVTRFKPHGVLAVLGPFNLPGHLPNGHIVPALIAGNAVVFKPSEQTPLVGQVMCEVFELLNWPPGLVNMVQGGRDTGIALSQHDDIDGLLFTGSYGAGLALSKTFAQYPERILALEMGGNNPLVVETGMISDLDAAAYHTVLSAYITAGQRCTCARRLIVIDSDQGDAFIDRLIDVIKSITVGAWQDEPEPFLGPVISKAAASRVLDAQQSLIDAGAKTIIESMRSESCPAMLSPGLINVTDLPSLNDIEIFGPLLQMYRVGDLDSAIAIANHTEYGLSAALFSDSHQSYETFFQPHPCRCR